MTRLALCLAALTTCGLLACAGQEGSECRGAADCSGGTDCLGPNAAPVCGIPVRADCASDSDCFDGVCHAIADACSASGIGSQCATACDSDARCGQGFRCGPTGACEAAACGDGWECPSHQVCDPERFAAATAVSERHHGCFDVACTADAECVGGQACVNGRCQDGVGFCRVAEQVP